MITTKVKDSGSLIYTRLQKHNCPNCQHQMKLIKMKKTVKARTNKPASSGFFSLGGSSYEKTQYIWYEFRCPACGAQFKEDALKEQEKIAKRKAEITKRVEKRLKQMDAKAAKKPTAKEVSKPANKETSVKK